MENHSEELNNKKSGFAVAGLVLGILGLCTAFIPIINNVSFIFGLLAIIFAIVALVQKASKGQAIASLILGIFAVIITINSQRALSTGLQHISNSLNNTFSNTSSQLSKMSGNSTEEILANDVEVKLGEFESTTGKYGITNTKLTVTVKNKTTEKKSFYMHIEAVDDDGTRISEDYVSANDLNAGQSQNFDIFTYVNSEKLSNMQKAKFKIVEVSEF